MNITSKPTPKSRKIPSQQSDIVIDSRGKIHISFLWDDLRDLVGVGLDETPLPPESWTPPRLECGVETLSEYASCRLCPKACGFDRIVRSHPYCGDFRLRVSTFGVTHGDEPAIRGTNGSGAILLSGCPLRCPSCHNPEKVAQGVEKSPEGFLRLCQSLRERGVHNIQILSPTVHLPLLREVLTCLKSGGFPLPIVLKSSGYESLEQIRKLDGCVDIYLPDFKFGRNSNRARRAGASDYFEKTSCAVQEMIRQVGPLSFNGRGVATRGVLVRHVQTPMDLEEGELIRNFINQLPEGVGVSVQDNFVPLE